MPSIRPSRSCRSLSMASAMISLRNTVAKNFALPSGSSPAEKPPGNITIWDLPISAAYSRTDSSISEAVRLRNTFVTTEAPARSKALALSYSQLVPGKTGINTWGFAVLWEQTYTSLA